MDFSRPDVAGEGLLNRAIWYVDEGFPRAISRRWTRAAPDRSHTVRRRRGRRSSDVHAIEASGQDLIFASVSPKCPGRRVDVMSASSLDASHTHYRISREDIMPNGSHDTICNRSPNRTFQEVVDARLSRRGFLGGGIATAAAVSLGGIGALLDAVPVSAKSHGHRDPLLGFQGIPVSSRGHRRPSARLHRQGAHRVGRPRVEWAGLQAGRQQHCSRAGAAVGHAQRRRGVFSARSTGWILGPRFRQGLGTRPSRAEQRVHRRRHPLSGWQRRTGQPRKPGNRRTPTACRSSRSRENAAAARTDRGKDRGEDNNGEWTSRPAVTLCPPPDQPDANEDRRAGCAMG